MSKITKATFKSFIRKNKGNLFVRITSRFDGMTDCVEQTRDREFAPAIESDEWVEHSCGVQGVWLVGGSRDWFNAFDRDGFTGIEFSNCCGSGAIAVKK